jgi:endonuclease YncB( thermonuclease family)
MGETPDPGWTTRGVISRVIDGDTVEVTIKRTIRVRLQDCWAAEKRLDPSLPPIDREAAKLRGMAAAEHLRRIAEGHECTLQIPTHPADGETQDIGDSFSMGRAVGRVWINGTDLSALQVRKGYATSTKGGGK